MKKANELLRRKYNAKELKKVMDKAKDATGNEDTAIRNALKNYAHKDKTKNALHADEQAILAKAYRTGRGGDFTGNVASGVGKFAPTNMVSAIGYGAGMMGSPIASTAIAAGTLGAKQAGKILTKNRAKIVDMFVRASPEQKKQMLELMKGKAMDSRKAAALVRALSTPEAGERPTYDIELPLNTNR